MEEKLMKPVSGYIMLVVQLALIIVGILSFSIPSIEMAGLFFILISLSLSRGYFTIEPGKARIITVLGSYKGTVKKGGFYWVHPFSNKKTVSMQLNALMVRNIAGQDKGGIPLEASLSLSWKVEDTAKATYEVVNSEEQVTKTANAVMKLLMETYPFERSKEDPGISLKGNAKSLSNVLLNQLNSSLENVGLLATELKILQLSSQYQDDLITDRVSRLVNLSVQKQLIADTHEARERLAEKLLVTLTN